MNIVTMTQGDSFAIPFSLFLNKTEIITPETIDNVEVFSGTGYDVLFRKTFSNGEVGFDESIMKWFFRLSQRETMELDPDSYEVKARVKIGDDVICIYIGTIMILAAQSREEI